MKYKFISPKLLNKFQLWRIERILFKRGYAKLLIKYKTITRFYAKYPYIVNMDKYGFMILKFDSKSDFHISMNKIFEGRNK
jgi:hypothetical protein